MDSLKIIAGFVSQEITHLPFSQVSAIPLSAEKYYTDLLVQQQARRERCSDADSTHSHPKQLVRSVSEAQDEKDGNSDRNVAQSFQLSRPSAGVTFSRLDAMEAMRKAFKGKLIMLSHCAQLAVATGAFSWTIRLKLMESILMYYLENRAHFSIQLCLHDITVLLKLQLSDRIILWLRECAEVEDLQSFLFLLSAFNAAAAAHPSATVNDRDFASSAKEILLRELKSTNQHHQISVPNGPQRSYISIVRAVSETLPLFRQQDFTYSNWQVAKQFIQHLPARLHSLVFLLWDPAIPKSPAAHIVAMLANARTMCSAAMDQAELQAEIQGLVDASFTESLKEIEKFKDSQSQAAAPAATASKPIPAKPSAAKEAAAANRKRARQEKAQKIAQVVVLPHGSSLPPLMDVQKEVCEYAYDCLGGLAQDIGAAQKEAGGAWDAKKAILQRKLDKLKKKQAYAGLDSTA